MNETMYEIDYTRALPPSLKNDKTFYTLGRVIAEPLRENVRLSRLNIIYARIDELPENVLDVIAVDMHIDWYDDTCRIDVKRRVIKDSVKVHKRKGTKYAVEQAVGNIQSNTKVEEWFEYGGEPYFFRLSINGRIATREDYSGIIKAISETKNVRSWLEKIVMHLTAETHIYTGVTTKYKQKYIYGMGQFERIGDGLMFYGIGGSNHKRRRTYRQATPNRIGSGLMFFGIGGNKHVRKHTYAVGRFEHVEAGTVSTDCTVKHIKRETWTSKGVS